MFHVLPRISRMSTDKRISVNPCNQWEVYFPMQQKATDTLLDVSCLLSECGIGV